MENSQSLEIFVIKKDGTKEKFELNKIINAVKKSAARVLIDFTPEQLNNICSIVEKEVKDSGKNDIVTGKIAVNLAWSGDAVYSMDVAEEEEEVYLNYSVPKEGSNVWFDGWVMPKGANTLLAQSFVNFLCSPEIAVRNMNKIGYTSAIVGDEVMDMINDWYGVEDGEEGYEVDLTYLFTDSLSDEYYTINDQGEKRAIVTVSERGRQFDAQYPDEETIMRCGIMEDFGDRIDNVIAMWENVKIGDISIWFTIFLIVFVVIIFAFMYGKKIIDKHKKKMRRLKYSK